MAPLRPVVLVCYPLTLRPQECLKPLLDLHFLSLSKFSLNLVSRLLATNYESVPSLKSFLLFKNQRGTP